MYRYVTLHIQTGTGLLSGRRLFKIPHGENKPEETLELCVVLCVLVVFFTLFMSV